MGSLRLTLCAGAAVATALAPMAYAAEQQGVWLTPASPAPGTDIRLAVRGCPGVTGTATSDAFVADARLVGEDGLLTGDTRVRTALAPGSYSITVGCDDQEVKGVISVAGPTASAPSAQPSPSGSASAIPTVPPSAPSSPVAPVHAGGGGTARGSSADARVAGPGALHAIIGLVLAGVACAAVVARSARRGRGAE
jgi:hypothetical protein